MTRQRIVFFTVALALLPTALPAQADSAVAQLSSPAARVMHRLRTEGVPGEAGFVLRSFGGDWTRREQEELADSLTAFIIRTPHNDEQSRLAAFETLVAAVSAEGHGFPFERASPWLLQIAESGASGYVQNAVFAIALVLPDRTEALVSLETLARQSGESADLAVRYLATRFGEPGLAAIQQLHREGSAGTPAAERVIAYASLQDAQEMSELTTLNSRADSAVAEPSAVAARVMLRQRLGGGSGRALFILRGFLDAWTTEHQDAVADSLTAFVINHTDDDGFESRRAALSVLVLSGRADGYGTPYRGAGERLRQIAERGDARVAGSALAAIAHLADSTEALRIAEDLARYPGDAPSSPATLGTPAARVMHQLRTEGILSQPGFVLRGLRGEWTRRQQEELADSLTAYVISRTPSTSRPTHLAAFETLTAAMSTEGFGVPFERGSHWLKQIAEQGAGDFVQRAVAAVATLQSDSTVAFAVLEDLARHPGPAAEFAVEQIAASVGQKPRAEAAIQRLYREGSAGTPRARRMIHYDLQQGAADHGESRPALAVLRGVGGGWTRQQQDALADSLTAFITTDGGNHESVRRAVLTLSLASRAEGDGTPYPGAGERLRRIAAHGYVFAQGGVLYAIAQLPDSSEALRIFEDLARSPEEVAGHAVYWLERRFGTSGLDALRRIHIEGSAGNPRARYSVSSIARQRGWVEPNR